MIEFLSYSSVSVCTRPFYLYTISSFSVSIHYRHDLFLSDFEKTYTFSGVGGKIFDELYDISSSLHILLTIILWHALKRFLQHFFSLFFTNARMLSRSNTHLYLSISRTPIDEDTPFRNLMTKISHYHHWYFCLTLSFSIRAYIRWGGVFFLLLRKFLNTFFRLSYNGQGGQTGQKLTRREMQGGGVCDYVGKSFAR